MSILIHPFMYDSLIAGAVDRVGTTNQFMQGSLRNLNNGDGIRYVAYVNSGTYWLKFMTELGNDKGIVDCYVDGVEVDSWDTWWPGNVYNKVFTTAAPIVVPTSKVLNIDLITDGKHAMSFGWHKCITELALIPETITDDNPKPGHVLVQGLQYDSILQGAWSLGTGKPLGKMRMVNISATDGDGLRYKVGLVEGTWTCVIHGRGDLDNDYRIYLDGALIGTPSWVSIFGRSDQTDSFSFTVTEDKIYDFDVVADGNAAIYFAEAGIYRTA